MLVEKQVENIYKNNTDFSNLISSSFVVLFILFISFLDNTINSKLFLVLPIVGFILSLVALKDFFGTKIEIIDKFCNFSSATSCNTIIN